MCFPNMTEKLEPLPSDNQDFIHGGSVPSLSCSLSSYAAVQWLKSRRWRCQLERSPNVRKVVCLNPSRDRPKSFKQILTASLPNARQQM